MEGWVQKESRHLSQWRPRYLILSATKDDGRYRCELCTYPKTSLLSGSAPKPTERIPLTAFASVEPDAAPRRQQPHTFIVRAAGREFRFSCESLDARDAWVEAIGRLKPQLSPGEADDVAAARFGASSLVSEGSSGSRRLSTASMRSDDDYESAAESLRSVEPIEYVALVAAGLDELAAREIERRLGLQANAVTPVPPPPPEDQWSSSALQTGVTSIFPGGAGVAKLRFSLPAPRDDEAVRTQIDALRRLPMVQALLAPLVIATDIARDGAGVAQVERAVVTSTRWGAALRTWRMIAGRPDVFRPSFRCSCVRDGQHAYGSLDVAAATGGGVHEAFQWRVDLKGFDVEVCLLLLQSQLVVGLTLSSGALLHKNRLPPEPRPLLPLCNVSARLRCSTAWAMLTLAAPRPGDVLLDPMAGVGTIPVEAAARWGDVFALAGDAERTSVDQAVVNTRWVASATRAAATKQLVQLPLSGGAAEVADDERAAAAGGALPAWHALDRRYSTPPGGGGVGVCEWDATRLPLRTASIDVVVVDLPFGMACKHAALELDPSTRREQPALPPHGLLLTRLRTTLAQGQARRAPPLSTCDARDGARHAPGGTARDALSVEAADGIVPTAAGGAVGGATYHRRQLRRCHRVRHSVAAHRGARAGRPHRREERSSRYGEGSCRRRDEDEDGDGASALFLGSHPCMPMVVAPAQQVFHSFYSSFFTLYDYLNPTLPLHPARPPRHALLAQALSISSRRKGLCRRCALRTNCSMPTKPLPVKSALSTPSTSFCVAPSLTSFASTSSGVRTPSPSPAMSRLW